MEKVKVFLSDPQVLFREGIHFILSGEDDFEVTGETTNNEEALNLIQTNPPNVAILSLHDTKLGGPDIVRRIKRSLPSVAVILTMNRKEDESVFAAMKSGASACLTKDTDPENLLDTIRVVAQGSSPITDELLTPALATMTLVEFEDLAALNEEVDNLLANLTDKETEVLGALADGNTEEEVMSRLKINEETLRRNLRLILNKLVANDQARAVIEAAQRSLPSIIRASGKRDIKTDEFVTKAEFNEFKENLMERLKSLLGELK